MSRFNRFGKIFSDVISFYPGTSLADYDAGGANGQLRIEAALDRAVVDVLGSLSPAVYAAMTQVVNEFVVRYATAGQTTWTLGLFPIVAGTVHLWRYPLDTPLGGIGNLVGNSGFFYGEQFYKPPTKGYFEIATTDYSVNATTGVCTYTGAQSVQLGDRIYATYDVDADNAAFSMPQLGQAIVIGASAELGTRLYTQADQTWQLVTMYQARYDNYLKMFRDGTLIPDEVRKLNYWQEIERNNNEVKSFRLRRG